MTVGGQEQPVSRAADIPWAAAVQGISVREVLDKPAMSGAQVLAGAGGLDRQVRYVNIMEVPDVLAWTRADELLLTTGYPLRSTPQALDDFVSELNQRHLAGIAIKLGRYIDELPAVMLESADRLDFPVLRIPDGVGFDEILNEVLSDVLGRQAAQLTRAAQAHAELLDLVLHGGGLAEVAAALPHQLLPEDPGAVTVLHVDRTGRRTVATGADLDQRVAEALFDEDALFRTIRFRHGTYNLPGDGGTHSVLVASVAAENSHGRLIAVRREGAWNELDLMTLERGATVAALVVTRELAVAAVERKYRGDFLRDVLTARVDPQQAAESGRAFGWELTGPMVVVVAAVAEDPSLDDQQRRRRAEHVAASWSSWVRRRDATAASAAFAADAVAVLHTPDGRVPGTERVAELLGALSSPGVPFDGLVGVSRVVDGAPGLPGAYAQAWEAVRVGRWLSGAGSVSRFDDLGLYRLLSLVPDSAELRSFLSDTLGPLAAPEGDIESDELRRTLNVLLDTNLNVAQTARALHYHYNTLRYRIGKLERMLGPFTTDARLRADLMVALRVWQMRVVDR